MSPETPHIADAGNLASRVFEGSEILQRIHAAVASPGALVSVGRATEGTTPFLLASLTRSLERPVVAICASTDEAESLRRDWTSFADEGVREFPHWDSLFDENSEPDPDIYALRTETLDALAAGEPISVVAPLQAVLQPVARSEKSRDQRFLLRPGDHAPTRDLAKSLIEAGYRRFPQVARPGDFSIRGGIFDIYPREAAHPYRLDFFGDEIESIREVSIQDQRSRGEVPLLAFHVLPKDEYFIRGFTGAEVTLLDRLPAETLLVLLEPTKIQERCEGLIGQWAANKAMALSGELWTRAARLTRVECEAIPPEAGKSPITLPSQGVELFRGALDKVVDALAQEVARGTDIRILFRSEAEVERFTEILTEAEVGSSCQAVLGELTRGFRWTEPGGGIFLSGGEILGRTRSLSRRARKIASSRAVDSFVELEAGDLVVHVSHGIGRFKGVRELTRGRRHGDHLVIEFRDGVHLHVPAERIDLVQKYVGGTSGASLLDRLGGRAWSKKKARAEEAIHDLASEMLEVQALRAEREGFAFPPDNHWQEEFEGAFPFEETGDQLTTSDAVRRDLETPRPMDRLICGDVGYGKTELAMRASFKVVQAGKQVAVLVPTTVLAQQHLITFRDRMAEFPVRIEALSRFRSRKEQTEILRQAHEGEVDILIGTHRLLSNDVHLKDLGLIIIDEEQRFGVAHKEKLKQLRRLVDILTLTATPIPRTLHMSLLGVRDISSLSDAPQGRRAVKTEVCHFDLPRLRQIILRELNRDGQVFFVHNRVNSIEARTQELKQLIPEADMEWVHGQMDEHELEARMGRFLEKKCNVLVTTTIIESGLDIPSVNTIIIERADRFGLAELHQLRGRVGRGHHQAHAYFLLPEDRPLTPESRRRLEAIEEFSELGAGFNIAMRDLEIRGAGNILGKEQSGHIASIGYDLYCRLLERAVNTMRGTPWREPPDVDIHIAGHCQLPDDYITSHSERLRAYRAVATALNQETLVEIEEGLEDRYGPVPEEARNLLQLQALRIHLGRWGATHAEIEDGWLVLSGNRSTIKKGLAEHGWETCDLPDGLTGGRPRDGEVTQNVASVAEALGRHASSAR